MGILDAPTLADQGSFERVPFVKRARNHGNGLRSAPLVQFFDQAIEVTNPDVLVKIVVYLHRGRARAGTDAFHLLEREAAVSLCPISRRFLACSRSSYPPRNMQATFVQT